MALGAVLYFIFTLPAGTGAAVNQLTELVRHGLESALQALAGLVG